jgi:hypothetical protein
MSSTVCFESIAQGLETRWNWALHVAWALHGNVSVRAITRPCAMMPCSVHLLSSLVDSQQIGPRFQNVRDTRHYTRSWHDLSCRSPIRRGVSVWPDLPWRRLAPKLSAYAVRRYLRTCTQVTCGFTTAE